MNRRPSGLSVSKALVGYFNTKAAEGLSPRTLRNYEHRLQQWAEFVGDVQRHRGHPAGRPRVPRLAADRVQAPPLQRRRVPPSRQRPSETPT